MQRPVNPVVVAGLGEGCVTKLCALPCLLVALLPCLASAMALNPRDSGQVLLFPYYTVNKQQQTLISVVNTTQRGKAVRVRFREAYDGREVLDFNVFLPANAVWTTALFSLSDAGLPGSGAAIIFDSALCTEPKSPVVTTKLPDGRRYQPFLHFAYTGAEADSGPQDDVRTREGNFEIIEMAEVTGNSLAAISPVNGIPPGCASAVAALIPVTDLAPPRGGLMGSASIVNVAEGTFYSMNATAIDGFRNQPMLTPSGTIHPGLDDGSISASGLVTAYVPINGQAVQLNYPPSQAIDAVSALLTADHISTEWDVSPAERAQTDWVITFPTKHFYTDPKIVGSASASIPPFPRLFGVGSAGRSDVNLGYRAFDRLGGALNNTIGIDPPPPVATPGLLSYETQVGTFSQSLQGPATTSLVLGSGVATAFPVSVFPHTPEPGTFAVGTALLDLNVTQEQHQLRPSADGLVMNGLPVIGFEAINYINTNVAPGVLANYSGAYPIRATVSCVAPGLVVEGCN